MTDDLTRAMLQSVADGFEQTVSDLGDLVRIPSVSWDAYDQSEVRASAEAVARLAEATGIFENVRIVQVPNTPESEAMGRPAVLARRAAAAGKPTVLLYAHHDVQPWGDESLWRTPPFEPTIIDGRMYGRGASDDKAGVMTHIAAIRALEQVDPGNGLGIALFVEGEEEFGSPSFANLLATHVDDLAGDVIVVADSDNWSTEVPSLTVALRGNVTFRLTLTTLEHANHSGMYGGAVPDAPLAMIRLLGTLWDANGAVAVAGAHHSDLQAPEHDESHVRAEAGVLDGVELLGEGNVLARMWYGPSITVTGMDIPSVQDAANTILPSVAARLSMRVAPGQSAAEAFAALEQHLREHVPFGAKIEITEVDLGDPFLVDQETPAAVLARAAMADAWGQEAKNVGIGGSIPFISQLQTQFPDAQILVTGVEDPATMAHSPNESQHLGVLQRAIGAEALLLARLARS